MTHPPIDGQITFLYTRNLAATAHFYEKIMELPLKLDQGSCRVYRLCGNSYVGFCQRADAPTRASDPGTRHIILTFVTPKVDEWYRLLSERGIIFEKPPAINPQYKIYHCFLRDPNGYLIEIQRFLEPF